MENSGTRDISKEGFVPITSNTGKPTTVSEYPDTNLGGDQHGIRYIPSIIDFLEKRFAFSAALISVIGYVIIAAFGEIQSMGQYLGYAIFLGIVLLVYKSNEMKKLHLVLSVVSVLLLIAIVILTWDKLVEVYSYINHIFAMKIAPAEVTPLTP